MQKMWKYSVRNIKPDNDIPEDVEYRQEKAKNEFEDGLKEFMSQQFAK